MRNSPGLPDRQPACLSNDNRNPKSPVLIEVAAAVGATHEPSSQPGALVAANVDRIGAGTPRVPVETDRLLRVRSTRAATTSKLNHPGDGTAGRRSVEALSE
jgi:hypothetical protein